MKASINLDTGLLIESQSYADDATLISNAASAGFNNVEIRIVSQQELDLLIAARTPLSSKINNAITKTYTDVDSIYSFAIGNRSEEYKQAEAAALAYQAAGYIGSVSEYISSWATSNAPMTNAQSADAIIARAVALRSAMVAMRTQRFVSQAAMRAATTNAELNSALSTWNTFVATTKAALT